MGMTGTSGDAPPEVTLGLTAIERLVAVAGFAVAGGVLGFFLPRILEAAGRLPWIPFEGPLRLLEALGDGLPVGTAVIGAAVGACLTVIGTRGSATITISPDRVVIVAGGQPRAVARDPIARIYKDGDELVLLDAHDQELDRASVDASAATLASAFSQYGYPWASSDLSG